MSAGERTPGDGSIVACLHEHEGVPSVLVYEDLGEDDEPTVIIPCKSDSAARNLLKAIETFAAVSVI
jgi:hypothetical protein